MYVPKPVHEQQAPQTGTQNNGRDGVVFVKNGQASGQAAQRGAAKATTPSTPQASAAKASVTPKNNAAAPAEKNATTPAANPAAKVSAPQTKANAPKATTPEQPAPARKPVAREGYRMMQPTPAKRNAKATVEKAEHETATRNDATQPEVREAAPQQAPDNFASVVPSEQQAKTWAAKKMQLNHEDGQTLDAVKAAATVGAKDQAQISGVAPEELATDDEDENHVQDATQTDNNATDNGTTGNTTATTADQRDAKVTMPDSYTGDDVEVPLDDSKLQKAVNDVKQAGLQITQDPTKTETVIPEMKDGMQKQLQGDMDSQATKIEQELSNYEQQKATYDKAVASLPDEISGTAHYTGSMEKAGFTNTKGMVTWDRPCYIGDQQIYCTQPYGNGPGVNGVSTHVTLKIGNEYQNKQIAGILFYGYGGPDGDKGGYSELETHLALAYWCWANNAGNKAYESHFDGVNDDIANKWLHYGKVQQLLNQAKNFDQDDSWQFKIYSGNPDNEHAGTDTQVGADGQLMFAAKFVQAHKPFWSETHYHEDKLYTDTPKAIKKVTNDEGFNENGKALMRGDKADYKLTWDFSGDKGLDITPGMKVAGLSISDTLPTQVGLNPSGITIMDGTTAVPMSDVNVQINGQTVTISAKNPVAFDKQYAGKALTVNLPTTVKVDGFAEAKNKYTVNHFGDKHTSNVVVVKIPPIHPKKDVVVSVADQKSLNNSTIQLGQTFDYSLDSSQRPANYGGDTTEWGIDDHLDLVHDQYTGQYHIYSTAPITLADGTVLPKGTILDKYFAVSYNPQTGDWHAEMLPSLMKIMNLPVNKKIAQGWDAFIQCKRIAPGTVYNIFTETYNHKVMKSNRVVTHTPTPKKTPGHPGTPSHPGIPFHPGMPTVQAATVHPASPVAPRQHQRVNQLPDTGDSQHNNWWLIGGALLAGAAGLALTKKREA